MTVRILDEIVGETCVTIAVDRGGDRIEFTMKNGDVWEMLHFQDCCESVKIDEIVGDISDLLGEPLLLAEERSNEEGCAQCGESSTWTFYEFRTIKGSVTIRWFGSSNGYYSERVDFVRGWS